MLSVEQALSEKWGLQKFIDVIGDDYPLLRQFSETKQDPEWHAEGDVHVHTDMVIMQMHNMLDNELAEIPCRVKAILIMACVFHDYAKPICTRERNIKGIDRIVAPNHESAGASLLFYLPPPLDMNNDDWYQVIQLTAYHHIPKLLVIKSAHEGAYSDLSMKVESLSWLYYLERADMLGRTCSDIEEQLLLLDIFRDEATKYGLWDKNAETLLYKPFLSQIKARFNDLSEADCLRIWYQGIFHYEQGNIFMLEEELSRAFQYKDKQPHLILLCGVSGCGKSSITRNYQQQGYEVISLDGIRKELFGSVEDQSNNDAVVRESRERLKQCLRDKKNIIWDATNTRIDFRNPMIGLGFAYGAFIEILLLQKPTNILVKDNLDRPHPVPEERLLEQIDTFQIPHRGDAHKLTVRLFDSNY